MLVVKEKFDLEIQSIPETHLSYKAKNMKNIPHKLDSF